MDQFCVKVVDKPTVVLLAGTTLRHGGMAGLLQDADSPDWHSDTVVDAQLLVELAGRTCYQSFTKPRPGGNNAYIKHVLEVGHGSVLEHASWTFAFAGVSRSLTHELVRHRAGMAYSQLSQRYVDEAKRAACVVPDVVRRDPVAFRIWEESVNASQAAYRKLISRLTELYAAVGVPEDVEDKTTRRKAARGAARSVLPNASETKIVVTGNARSWRHFLEMRCSPAADKEIRDLAYAVYQVLVVEAPNLFGDYETVPHSAEGGYYLVTKYKKV